MEIYDQMLVTVNKKVSYGNDRSSAFLSQKFWPGHRRRCQPCKIFPLI